MASNIEMLGQTATMLGQAKGLVDKVSSSLADTPAPPPPPPDPSPTPTPTPTPVPVLPGKTNTGPVPGTELKPWAGGTISDGAVIEARSFSGQVSVAAKGVVFRNCRWAGSGNYCAYIRGGSARFEHCEFTGNFTTAAIAFDNWEAYACNFWGLPDDAVKLGSNAHLRASWVHDMNPEPGAHADGVQVQNGVVGSSVEDNNIYGCSNAAVFISPDLGPTTDGPLTVKGNHLDGGNYTLYVVDGNNGEYFIRDITVSGNLFGRSYRYGSTRVNVPCTWSGNVYADDGSAVRA